MATEASLQQEKTPLYAACKIAASFRFGIVTTLTAPFQIADFGSAHPLLQRYLRGPFLHSTPTGLSSSMETRIIWAGSFFLYVAILSALISGPEVLTVSEPISRPFVLWGVVWVATGMSALLLLQTFNANDIQWTCSFPMIEASARDIRFAFLPNTRGWQPEGTA